MKKSLLLSLFVALLIPMVSWAQPMQMILGHYESDNLSSQGYAMSSPGLLSLAVMFDTDELEIYQGGKIVAIRFGLVEPAEITKVFIIPVLQDGKYGTMTEWPVNAGEAGWNVVELDTPYDINVPEGEKLLVGYYFRQVSGAKPLSIVQEGLPYDTYTYKKVGSVTKWRETDFINYGNLSLQCVVEKESFPDYSLTSYGLQCDRFVVVGEDVHFSLNVKNKGIKRIEPGELAMNVLFDGNLVYTITNPEPIENGYYNIRATAPTTGIEPGSHSLTVVPASVNDQEIEGVEVGPAEFTIYRQGFPRQKHLVEQLTSTYCRYCPLGNSMLSILTSQRDDVAWVGIHGNLGSGVDPFRSNQGDSLLVFLTGGSVSYPSGAFDRSTGWEDEVNIVSGLGYSEAYHQLAADLLGSFLDYLSENLPTVVEIKGDCLLNRETRMATVKIHGKISPDFDAMMGEDARLTVYLVEDSLVAKQLNGDEWISRYVHNGVFRMALGSVKGEDLKREGGRYRNDYRFKIPNAYNLDHLRVVAFVSRPITNYASGFTDMYVNNADYFKFEDSAAIDEIVTDPDAVPVEYYDITGRQFNGLQQGINIVKMSDGTTRKVLVK